MAKNLEEEPFRASCINPFGDTNFFSFILFFKQSNKHKQKHGQKAQVKRELRFCRNYRVMASDFAHINAILKKQPIASWVSWFNSFQLMKWRCNSFSVMLPMTKSPERAPTTNDPHAHSSITRKAFKALLCWRGQLLSSHRKMIWKEEAWWWPFLTLWLAPSWKSSRTFYSRSTNIC